MVLLGWLLASCGGGNGGYSYNSNPLDDIIRKHMKDPNYTVILYDMNYDEAKDQFQHRYLTLVNVSEDSLNYDTTNWLAVSPQVFQQHENDLGMELMHKTDGKLTKQVVPAGFTDYVGNEKYGHWVERDGGSFWEFYGKYMFLSHLFGYHRYPVNYGLYSPYYRDRRYGGNYYGSYNGGRAYGSNGTYSKGKSSSTWNSKSNSFKTKVNQRAKQSSSVRRSRSSSRYSRSSSRSRGGGFGK